MSRAALMDDDAPPRCGFSEASLADVPGRWHAIQVKPRQEKPLAHDLLRAGVKYYLPLAQSLTIAGRKRRVTEIPLFAGYLFAATTDDDFSVAFETHRAIRAIEVKQQARLVRELSNVERALVANPRIDPCAQMVEGVRCRVTAGALEGVEGVMVRRGSGTIIVLSVTGFGQGVVEVDYRLLESADPN